MSEELEPIDPTSSLDVDFIEGWLNSRRSKKGSNAIRMDEWDLQTYHEFLDDTNAFNAARNELKDFVSTGGEAWVDTFMGLFKAMPGMMNKEDMLTSFLVNHRVLDVATQMDEFQRLRSRGTSGDELTAGVATMAMLPHLKALFDRLDREVKKAQEAAALESGLESVEEAIEALQGLLDGDQDGEGAEALAKAQAQAEGMQKSLAQVKADLEKMLGESEGLIREGMRNAMEQAEGDLSGLEAARSWGFEPGALRRVDAQKRLELAKKLNSPRFKKLFEIVGPMREILRTEQSRKVKYARSEIHDVTMGRDLARAVASEMTNFRHRLLRLNMLRRMSEGGLLTYEMRGRETVGKGAMIVCEDGSGSMKGAREMWAKAVNLCLLYLARKQKRPFRGIHFGSANEIKVFDFSKSEYYTPDKIIDFAEWFVNGGTDFATPLTLALTMIQEDFARTGVVNADIVFITDGMCNVGDKWLAEFKAEQERLGFRVYGVIIGGGVNSEPLKTICDSRIWTIGDMTSGEEMRAIFGAL